MYRHTAYIDSKASGQTAEGDFGMVFPRVTDMSEALTGLTDGIGGRRFKGRAERDC